MQTHTFKCDHCGEEVRTESTFTLGHPLTERGIHIRLQAGFHSGGGVMRDFCGETCLCGWLLANLHPTPEPKDLLQVAISEHEKAGNERLDQVAFRSGFLAGWLRGRELPDA